MPALITTLIDKQDTIELVRDKVAAILLEESAGQQALATDDGKDPGLWKLRVFLERFNPWVEFGDHDSPWSADTVVAPIVNVSIEQDNVDLRASDLHERQKSTATYNVDCYGYGVSADTAGGHRAGDAQAAFEAFRAARLVRNILMSAHYVYLGLPRGATQVVSRRWIQTREQRVIPIESQTVERIAVCRMTLNVDLHEFSPQVDTTELESILATVYRAENGEVYLAADYSLADS